MKNQIFSVLGIILLFPFMPCNSQDNRSKGAKESVLEQLKFFSQDLFVSGENNVNQYRIPSIVTTNKGTLLVVCDARVDRPGDAPNNIDLVMKKSFDGGKTWSKPEVIVDFPGNDAGGDPSMTVDRETGTIWLAYDYAVSDPQGYLGRIIRIHLKKSDDDGRTWSPSVDISYLTKGKDFWLQNGPGVGLYADGVIVFPMYTWPSDGKSRGTVLVYSKDNGKTWLLSNSVGDFNPEPQIVSLTGGRIMANMRRQGGFGCRQVSITDDLGKTWSEVYNDTVLTEPGYHASLINYKFKNKSLLIFSNPNDKKERKNMVVRVSYDEGKSWQKELAVYGGSAAYSCLTQLPNGNVGLLYEADKYQRMVFVEIPYEAL